MVPIRSNASEKSLPMQGYRFAESAEEDLAEIVRHTLQSWGAKQATRYIDGLEVLAEKLATTPKIGKACETFSPGLRAFPCESHVLYYLSDERGVVILRVLHKSMNPALHLGDAGSR